MINKTTFFIQPRSTCVSRGIHRQHNHRQHISQPFSYAEPNQIPSNKQFKYIILQIGRCVKFGGCDGGALSIFLENTLLSQQLCTRGEFLSVGMIEVQDCGFKCR